MQALGNEHGRQTSCKECTTIYNIHMGHIIDDINKIQ